ncbi:hypothetical protein [Desulfohalovibrio reitneri]|uniref:hypothetical protein n=1 Tax=Desulfohalovibrio reitneri TaxID=1307759 RepID=UPI0004A75D22|nr:hypothetical protein [Desulfohalovibrio reitneri]
MKRLGRKAAFRKLAALYNDMQTEYDKVAQAMGHTCKGCTDNCCVSHFQHHTYLEWAYFWEGMDSLDQETRQAVIDRAKDNLEQVRASMAVGQTPKAMCPVNVDGLCILYQHRLMICRLHGIPNTLTSPRTKTVSRFPGCHLSQRIAEQMREHGVTPPALDRTPLYRRLVELEQSFLGSRFNQLPKVDLTLSQMIVQGPPQL